MCSCTVHIEQETIVYIRELTDELAVKASCVDDWSGVLPENPRAGVLNWVVGAAHELRALDVKYGGYAPAALYPQWLFVLLKPNCVISETNEDWAIGNADSGSWVRIISKHTEELLKKKLNWK